MSASMYCSGIINYKIVTYLMQVIECSTSNSKLCTVGLINKDSSSEPSLFGLGVLVLTFTASSFKWSKIWLRHSWASWNINGLYFKL